MPLQLRFLSRARIPNGFTRKGSKRVTIRSIIFCQVDSEASIVMRRNPVKQGGIGMQIGDKEGQIV